MLITQENIRKALSEGCSHEEFLQMRCPKCHGDLQVTVHPKGRKFFVRCTKDSTHLAMQGESENPPEWFRERIGGGWY